MTAMRAVWLRLILALFLACPGPLAAQDTPIIEKPVSADPALTGDKASAAGDDAGIDYAEWERTADLSEAEIESRASSDERLDAIRSQLSRWRAALSSSQSANSARIESVQEQLAALGAAPVDGTSEPDEISKRRKALADQLVRLQAPGIAAEEAYRRADGLIKEIDRIQRERQAEVLLQLWPSPVNPTNWPEAAIGLSDTVLRLWDEVSSAWADKDQRANLIDNLPLILVLLVVALALVVYVRGWVERFAQALQERASARGRRVWSLLASLGTIAIPTLGTVALAAALQVSGLPGETGLRITLTLPYIGFVIAAAAWLGARAFPKTQGEDAVLPLPSERRAEGRFLSVMMGVILGAHMLRSSAMDAQAYSDATTAVMTFPIVVVAGFILIRTGRILRGSGEGTEKSYALRLLSLLARGLSVIGFASPAIAALGYVHASTALIYPAILSLALVTLLFILQRLIGDIWSLVNKSEDDGREALMPVLAGFGLSLASLPVFTLIWGARLADLTELWSRFREGFQMGETRISPTDFLVFAIVFILGYMLTRLFQGALRTTILPKTRMDSGGQTALVAGIGYVGIFLAALIAINAAGLDLSSLAIVAGALSVGIGFGLQNIVSNFISGIILLIERPVSEGDWIEVGAVQGKVKSISVRSTRIETFDRNDVIVPNADLITGQVTNWTRFNLSGRLIVPVGVAFGSDTRKVERMLMEIAEAQPLAVLNPPPVVVLMGFGADSMNFEIRVILRDVNFSLNTRSEINHQIVERFAAEGIEIPFSQQDITLRNAAELGAAFRGMQSPAAVTADPAPDQPAPLAEDDSPEVSG